MPFVYTFVIKKKAINTIVTGCSRKLTRDDCNALGGRRYQTYCMHGAHNIVFYYFVLYFSFVACMLGIYFFSVRLLKLIDGHRNLLSTTLVFKHWNFPSKPYEVSTYFWFNILNSQNTIFIMCTYSDYLMTNIYEKKNTLK